MPPALTAISVLLLILYAAATVASIVVFASKRAIRPGRWKLFIASIVTCHAADIALRAMTCRCCPLGTVLEALGVAAFALVAVYFILEMRGGDRPTGVLILPLAFLMELVSVLMRSSAGEVNPALQNPWFSLHALAAVLAVAALAVSFVHGVFYLLLYREIKGHRFGRLFRRLPPLNVLARMTNFGALIGWVLLCVTIGAGYAWGKISGRYEAMHADPLFIVTCAAWAMYTIGVALRFIMGWRGRVTVVLSVCGFALLILVLTVVSLFLPSIHEFR